MGHGTPDTIVDRQIAFADSLGIEKLQISRPSSNEDFKPEEVKRNNEIVLAAMKKYPDGYIGFFTLNPRYPEGIT